MPCTGETVRMAAVPLNAEVPQLIVRRSHPNDIDTLCAMFDRQFPEEGLQEVFAAFHGVEVSTMNTAQKRQAFFVSLIETSYMSVTVEDEEDNIVGFAALDDVPLQMGRVQEAGTEWEEWFESVYHDETVDGMNTLWCTCCLVEDAVEVVSEILRTTFSTMTDIQNLLVFIPGGIHDDDVALLRPFEAHFNKMEPMGEGFTYGCWASANPVRMPPSVLMCRRADVITPLFIRMAKVEDHDNLVEIFDAQSEVVREVYGEYFIAELIESQNDENKALVAEVDGRAVGLMCLTSDVDVNVLAQCFELDPYDNLLKPHYMGRVRDHAQAILNGSSSASLASMGDFMQVALASVNMEEVLSSIPADEQGRISALQLLQAMQLHEFTDEVGEALPDFGQGVMVLLWQMNFLEPMLEGGSLIDPKQVTDCVQLFLQLDIHRRRELAAAILKAWEEVEERLNIALEAVRIAALELKEGAESSAKDSAPAPPEASAAPVAVEAVMFLKTLCDENEGPFDMSFLAQLVMAIHWWSNEDISNPSSITPEDGFKGSLESIHNSEEGLFVGHPQSPTWLSSMPQHAKDVFCVNICCLDQAYQMQACDFLLPAFSLYPEKDYCVITQPHTAPNTPLLNAFTIVPPQPQNTFSHVLYLIHRAALLGPPKVRYFAQPDLEHVPPLIANFDDEAQKSIQAHISNFLMQEVRNKDAGVFKTLHSFVAEFDEQIVGLVLLQMPAPEIVDTLRCCYHLDDYLIVEQHEGRQNKGHGQLVHWVLNPLFAKYTRRLHQGAMRLSGTTVLFMETELQSTVSPIFREFLQVAPRRPPQLKKASRKPPKVATFAKVEKEVKTEDDIKEDERQKLLRDNTQTKALSIVSKKYLSETKIPVNARIVVVGASDCSLSFLESLLSIPHLVFNSLTLLAPGGLEYHHAHHLPLIAGSAAYSHHELRRIMLELRVRILDSRMVQVDRAQRCCILHDGSMLPYDYLIVSAGLQDDALHGLKVRSWGVEHVTDGYRRVNGAMSVADSSIRDLLVEGGTLVKSLIWNPLSYAVVYGRSLHAYCVVQGLLMRKVPPTKIILVLPPRLKDASHQLPVDAFQEGDEVERKIHGILERMDMKVYDGYKLISIQQDNRERLKALVLEDHTGGLSGSGDAPKAGQMEDHGMAASGIPLRLLACRIIITADSVNVDPDIFNSVHGNGLVYDGRLIVDHNFKTTDDGIFGAGSLCEFSRRFQRKNQQRYLRHDGFNGREVGAKLAQALLRVLDPVNGEIAAAGGPAARPAAGEQAPKGTMAELMEGLDEESSPELLPEFHMPIAKGGLLPGNLHYYRIHSCRKAELQIDMVERTSDQIIVTDTLDTMNGRGHFCRLTVDNFGKVDSITYLGGEELQVESLWSLVGLSETFLNHLWNRWRDGDIPDIVEFLTDEWATALYHDRFMDFCHQIKLEMLSQDDVRQMINSSLENVNTKDGVSRKMLESIREKLPKESVKLMQDHLLEYLRENTNHLKTYFLPGQWSGAL